MNKLTLIIVLFFCGYLNAQNKTSLDSLSEVIKTLPKREQVKIITSQDFGAISEDLKTYEFLVNKALNFSLELKDSLLIADSYFAKVFVANAEDGIEYALKANKIYEALDEYEKMGAVYTSLGWQLKRRDFKKAFKYYQTGLKMIEKHNPDAKLDPLYDNFGVMHGMKKDWDSALFYHHKSLKIKKNNKDSLGIPFGYSHLANVMLNLKKYQLAEKYLDSSLTIRKLRKDIYGITDTYLYYGDLYFSKGDFDLANNYFYEAYLLGEKNHYTTLKKYAAEYLFKGNDTLKNYEQALKYHLIYSNLKDSILNINTNSKIAELDVQFQTEKKEKELLKQRTQLAEQKSYIIIALFSVFFAVLIGVLIYIAQRNKNKQLQKEKELGLALLQIESQNNLQHQRLEISRDLHDTIGAQLTFIISSIDNLKYGFTDVSSKVGDKLSHISNFTKDTIYELRDTIWAMNKDEITVEDLNARISNFITNANLAAEHIDFKFKSNLNEEHSIAFNSKTGMNLYRIIQEAVNNAIKHAEASKIVVEVLSVSNELTVSIKDNGKGFDINEIETGNGLVSMEKRAEEINALFKLQALEKGSEITLALKNKSV
jgi:signal transduction histidine kinase